MAFLDLSGSDFFSVSDPSPAKCTRGRATRHGSGTCTGPYVSFFLFSLSSLVPHVFLFPTRTPRNARSDARPDTGAVFAMGRLGGGHFLSDFSGFDVLSAKYARGRANGQGNGIGYGPVGIWRFLCFRKGRCLFFVRCFFLPARSNLRSWIGPF